MGNTHYQLPRDSDIINHCRRNRTELDVAGLLSVCDSVFDSREQIKNWTVRQKMSKVSTGRDGDATPVVRVTEDSNKLLEELFQVVQNGVPPKAGKPMLERQLPSSFFHANDPQKQGITSPCLHSRSFSMPATIDGHVYARQFAQDALQSQPLPPGWEPAKTPDGISYYIE